MPPNGQFTFIYQTSADNGFIGQVEGEGGKSEQKAQDNRPNLDKARLGRALSVLVRDARVLFVRTAPEPSVGAAPVAELLVVAWSSSFSSSRFTSNFLLASFIRVRALAMVPSRSGRLAAPASNLAVGCSSKIVSYSLRSAMFCSNTEVVSSNRSALKKMSSASTSRFVSACMVALWAAGSTVPTPTPLPPPEATAGTGEGGRSSASVPADVPSSFASSTFSRYVCSPRWFCSMNGRSNRDRSSMIGGRNLRFTVVRSGREQLQLPAAGVADPRQPAAPLQVEVVLRIDAQQAEREHQRQQVLGEELLGGEHNCRPSAIMLVAVAVAVAVVVVVMLLARHVLLPHTSNTAHNAPHVTTDPCKRDEGLRGCCLGLQ
uniref:Uncharacterized protein n=1 Tax=Anopheles merus TaxID=30066 RepID=A0A182VJ28_ANOME